jgi:hypothetical protein
MNDRQDLADNRRALGSYEEFQRVLAEREDAEEARIYESTEHSEHLQKTPANGAEKVFGTEANTYRTPTEHFAPPALAHEPKILESLDEQMGQLGLVGERHIARSAYLVHLSRLLDDPGRAVVKGASSTGKSYATECALEAAAPEYLWIRTQTSPLAMFYSEESFEHRTLVLYEANKLGDDDDPFARVVRTLLSEGKLAYEYTDALKHRTQYLEKTGPVAFISTVAKPTLDKEVETRILSLQSDASDKQTEDVVRSLLEDAVNPKAKPSFEEWHALDRWVADQPAGVVVPWAKALAGFNLAGPPRLRRDVTNLLALVRAHALLHRATRELDAHGRVIATLADYEVVRDLLSDALAIATDKAVRPGTREVVEAVEALRAQERPPPNVSMRAAARAAERSVSTASTDVQDALDRGYLIDRSTTRYMDLDVGEPMPTHEDLLPSVKALAEAAGKPR